MDQNKKIAAVVLTLILAVCCFPVEISAGRSKFGSSVRVVVDGAEAGYIPAFDDHYENNLCISLKGVAYCLRDTGKAFAPTVEKNAIDIAAGASYRTEPQPWSEADTALDSSSSSSKHPLYVDGAERKYYSFILRRGSEYDAFFTPMSLSMLLNVQMRLTEAGLEIDASTPCSVSMQEVEASGYLQGVNALVTGDATTGELFYAYRADEAFPIASTSKLMTYLVFMNAVTRGDCALTDTVTVSARAARLSETPDGVIPMTEGMRVPVRELLYGMLVASSNECALALAEHAALTQEAFVAQMNAQAEELGLSDAKFYNCHGLPVFDTQLLSAKMQNYMTAAELFRLCSVLLRDDPQITEITSTKKIRLETLNKEIKSTNPMLYNLEYATGLKTGTTNRAGACLVTCVTELKDGQPHNLVTVLLGAEGDVNRGLLSEAASRYAVRALKDETLRAPAPLTGGIPDNPEAVVKRLIELLNAQK